MRDAEEYTISIRLESIEGDRLYVARVEELPDVEEYADTYDFARELVIDTIKTTQKVFERKGLAMPAPKVFNQPDVSGRVTLRLPRSVHAKCIQEADKEGVSLNTFLVSKISNFSPSTNNSDIYSLLTGISADLSDIKMKSHFASQGYKIVTTANTLARTFTSTVKVPSHIDEEEVAANDVLRFRAKPHWGRSHRC